MNKFTHIDDSGNVKQVDVSSKPILKREAQAYGFIHLSKETLRRIRSNTIAKGNVLATARIAGIQAAKKTADLIPLCHSLLIEHIQIDFKMEAAGIGVISLVSTTAKTGVEMEALTSVNVALLTIYDMCKAVDKTMSFNQIRLLKKTKEALCQP